MSQRELALELDKYRFPSDEPSFQGSYGDTESMGGISSLKTPTSPVSNQDKSKSNKSPDKVFNPFPRSSARQPKELGLRLGLYKDPTKSPAK